MQEEDIEKPLYKTITIKYDDMDVLLNREIPMLKTLQNYLERENDYEFVESYITQSATKSILNLRIKLKE